MKRKLILTTLFNLLAIVAFSQFYDDCEWNFPNVPLHWGGNPAVSNSYSNSPVQSIVIPDDGFTDVLLDLGNKIDGQWGLEFWMYVPSNREAYLNLQGQIPVGGGEWIVGNFFFNQDLINPGVGLIDDTANGIVSFTFPHDEWFKLVFNFDLSLGINQSTWELNIADEEVIPQGTPFTNSDGDYPTSLGGVDFFSISSNNYYYLDDFLYVEGVIDPIPAPLTNFQDEMEYLVGEPLSEWWLTPIQITNNEFHGGEYSGFIPGNGSDHAALNLGHEAEDFHYLSFWMKIPTNKEATFNLKKSPPVWSGESVMGDVRFNPDGNTPGMGIIENSPIGPVSFSYPQDEWFVVEWDIETNGPICSLYINDEIILDQVPFGNDQGELALIFEGIDFYSNSSFTEFYLDDIFYTKNVLSGIDDLEKSQFKIAPNPVSDNLQLLSHEIPERIRVLNYLGQEFDVLEKTKELDVSYLPSGLYFVEVTINGITEVQRFIKN